LYQISQVDTIDMELGTWKGTETGNAAVGRGRRNCNCDYQNFRLFQQWCDDIEVEDSWKGALKD